MSDNSFNLSVESKYTVDYAFTVTLKPILYKKDPEQQYFDTNEKLSLILDGMTNYYTLVAELTKCYNIHYHGIIKFYFVKGKSCVRAFYNAFRDSKLFGFVNIKQITEFDVWKDYIRKDLKKFKEEINLRPILRDYYDVYSANEIAEYSVQWNNSKTIGNESCQNDNVDKMIKAGSFNRMFEAVIIEDNKFVGHKKICHECLDELKSKPIEVEDTDNSVGQINDISDSAADLYDKILGSHHVMRVYWDQDGNEIEEDLGTLGEFTNDTKTKVDITLDNIDSMLDDEMSKYHYNVTKSIDSSGNVVYQDSGPVKQFRKIPKTKEELKTELVEKVRPKRKYVKKNR